MPNSINAFKIRNWTKKVKQLKKTVYLLRRLYDELKIHLDAIYTSDYYVHYPFSMFCFIYYFYFKMHYGFFLKIFIYFFVLRFKFDFLSSFITMHNESLLFTHVRIKIESLPQSAFKIDPIKCAAVETRACLQMHAYVCEFN